MKSRFQCEPKFNDQLDRFLASLTVSDAETLRTGIEPLDSMAGGFPRGDVTILLGPSGVGKSVLMNNLALSISKREHVLIVPLQDGSSDNLIRKLVAIEAGIEPDLLRGKADAGVRIVAIDAADRLRERTLDCFVTDEMTIVPMLHQVSLESFSGIFSDCDALEGEGALLIDTMTLFYDFTSARQAILALKSLACYSDVSVVATIAGGVAMLDELSDAGCVVLLENRGSNSNDVYVEATMLKNNSRPIENRNAELVLNCKTLQIQ